MGRAADRKKRLARMVKAAAVLAAAVALTGVFVAEFGHVRGRSMEAALRNGDRVVFEKITPRLGGPQRFDIVAFKAPNDPDTIYIKRVIGLGDDVVEIRGGRLLVNAVEVSPPEGMSLGDIAFGPAAVSHAHYFVLGDNLAESVDSREWGSVPRDYVLGRVVLRFWPVGSWRLFRRTSANLKGSQDGD